MSAAQTIRRRILLVEDHADSCEMLAAAFSWVGHRVATALSGQDGLMHLATIPFDVAIVDLALPDFDGFWLARCARSLLGTDTPLLIAVTGFPDEPWRRRSYRAGFRAHLIKPVDVKVLFELVACAPGGERLRA